MILRAFCFAAIAAVCSSESVWDDISDADDFVEMGASTRALLSGGSGGGSGAGQPAPAPTPTLHAQLVFDGTCDGGANALTKEECMLYAAESNLLPHNNSINIRHSEFRTELTRTLYPAGPFGQCIVLTQRRTGWQPEADVVWRIYYNSVIPATSPYAAFGANMTVADARNCTEVYPCVCKTAAGAAPTPSPTPSTCPTAPGEHIGPLRTHPDTGRAICDCPSPLYQKTLFADSRRRWASRLPTTTDAPFRYHCKYTGPPTPAPTPATPAPTLGDCPFLDGRSHTVDGRTFVCNANAMCNMDMEVCSSASPCGCNTLRALQAGFTKKEFFADSRRRTTSFDSPAPAVRDDPPRYYCGSNLGTNTRRRRYVPTCDDDPVRRRRVAPTTNNTTRAPRTPTTNITTRAPRTPTTNITTRAPRRATRAPTPAQKFRLRQPKLVLLTKLFGYNVASFNRGVRWAYRRAFASRYGIADLRRVIITNIRGVSTRRLSSSRALATAAVEFDVQVGANTTTAAMALKAEVKGGDASEQAALVAAFTTEVALVATEGDYPQDVPANYQVPAAVAIETVSGQVQLETDAPTPAPTAGLDEPVATASDGDSPLVPIIASVAAVAAVIAAVAVRRSKLRQAASSMPTDGNVQMADIVPGSSSVSLGKSNDDSDSVTGVL
jgi:hypothetical protein